MAIDSLLIEKTKIRKSVCIIGTGIGGGTLAHKLNGKKNELIIVEAGNKNGSLNRILSVNRGLAFGLNATRSIKLGGTSNLWHGVLSMLDPIDFKERDWIPYSGWPIDFADLLSFYKEASNLLGVFEFKYFNQKNLPNELKESLKKIPFRIAELENKLFQQPLPPVNFRDVILKETKNKEGKDCIYNLVALELKTSNNGKKVVKLIAAKPNGEQVQIYAETFIVCCGALETPRLLLNSKRLSENKNIGKYLMDHPMGNLLQVEFRKKIKASIYADIKFAQDMKIKSGVVMKPAYQEKYCLPNHNFYLRPSFIKGINDESEKVKLALLTYKSGNLSLKDVWKAVTNFNTTIQILTYKFSLNVTYKFADLFFITEQVPNPESRVSLSDKRDKFGYPIASVNWQMTEQDLESMKFWFDYLRESIFPEKYFSITHNDNDYNWKEVFTSAAHHVGTARMGDSPLNGVVDKNLKVFGTDNLYICDGSVFPTSGNVNSGLTISAFACRLASHLNRQ